jgi:hypothetical protein
MGWTLAELMATTTTRAPSDWLIGELFSYTELKEELFLTVAAWSSKYWHGIAPHKSTPSTFPGKTSLSLVFVNFVSSMIATEIFCLPLAFSPEVTYTYIRS